MVIDGASIREVVAVRGPSTPTSADLWVAPAFWDLQFNGRWGVSFSDPRLSVDKVGEIIRAQAALGTARACPTLITAPIECMLHGLRTIARACDESPDLNTRVVGIHLEGPYISSREGYRGAHPLEATHDPNWAEFQEMQRASGHRIALVTLAPERPGALDFIRRVSREGVRVAIGHTAADGETIRQAVDAGARLSTHLGNGIAVDLPRHPNPIWWQAAEDRLWASFIADGHHLDPATLKVMLRAKTPARSILVSDASPLAGLPPGRYGQWTVDTSGKIVVSDTPYLAGSNQDLATGINTLLRETDVTLAEAMLMVTVNPARSLGLPSPSLTADQSANLVLFHLKTRGSTRSISLQETCVDGTWIGV